MTAEKTLAQHADDAYESVRAIAALTVFEPVLPAPDLYPVLGSLALLGHALNQALNQLCTGLARSTEFYDLYEDNPDRDPAVSVAEALQYLGEAAELVDAVGRRLGHAQAAIGGQGYRGTQDQADDQDPNEQDGADR